MIPRARVSTIPCAFMTSWPLDLGLRGTGSIQRPWCVWMIQDPSQFGPEPPFVQIFVFLMHLCYFLTLFCFLHLCSWSKLLGKFYKFLYMFLLIFVVFLCILFTENLDEKYYCIFLLYFLNCLKIHENFVQILFQILDNCLWYILDNFVGLLLLFVFDFIAYMWILISYLACKALCS
jgi:hypothetical protein